MKDPYKKNGRAPKAGKPKAGRAAEITAVLMISFAVFSMICLTSYDSRDPSWANIPPAGHKIHNYAGRVGAYFAEAILQFMGLVAFLLPLAFGYVGVKTILPRGGRKLLLRTGGVLLLVLILCPLIFLLLANFPWGKAEIQAGGILGDLVSSLLVRYLSAAGSLVLLASAFVLFLLFSTRWSLARTVHLFEKAFDSAFKDVRIKVTSYQKAKEREKMREKVNKKYAGETADERKEVKKKSRQERAPTQATPKVPAENLLFPNLGKKGDYSYRHSAFSTSASRRRRSTRTSSTRKSAGSRTSSRSSAWPERSASTTPAPSSRPTSCSPTRASRSPRWPT
jgi:DNA segregation ATPase FtsK/SpoIIIE-like protein